MLSDERERTAAKELHVAYVNTLFMQGACSLRTLLLIVAFYEAV